MDNLKIYNEIFMDVFSVEEDQLNDTFDNESVNNWDSIHQLNLITNIEDAFDVMFGTEESLSLTSYVAGLDILKSKFDISF